MIQGNIDRKFMDLYLSELLFWWCTVACHIKNENKKRRFKFTKYPGSFHI